MTTTILGLIADKTLIPAKDFLALKGLSAHDADQSTRDHRLFRYEHEGSLFYLAVFADPRLPASRLASVCQILGGLPAGSQLQFFINARGSLGGIAPIEALSRGMLREVENAARGFAE
jgi:hypothetical protein